VFHLHGDKEHWKKYEIEGRHKWGLGGITCTTCGRTWATTGLSYPAVNLSEVPTSERYFSRGGLSVDTLKELKVPLRSIVPVHFILQPGTTFGPFSGTADGHLEDLILPDWILFVRKKALQGLIAAGIKGLVGVPAVLQFLNNTPAEELLELQVEPHSLLAAHVLPPIQERPTCSVCGYQTLKAPSQLALIGTSIPRDMDLFRGRDLTTYIFATERFIEAVEQLGLTGLVYEEVEITQG
jgi:uncharacterized double-CXXCG motif protein